MNPQPRSQHSPALPASAAPVPAPLIVIAGGGTGGHVFPGLAIAAALQSRGARVAWLVAGGMERGILESRAASFFVAPFSPPRATGFVYLWRLARAVFAATVILRREKPGAVLAMGGYASLPGGLAAALLRLPLLTHEQNAVPGRATMLLRRFARRTLGAFPDSPPQSETVGVPVDAEFHKLQSPESRYGNRTGPLRLLVLGGSQGARDLNLAAPKALAKISGETVSVTHQCGRGHLAETESAYRAAGVDANVVEFSSDIPRMLSDADVVLCRAGASTLAELAAAGVAALLSPYPHAAANHQDKNADHFARNGGAEKIPAETESAADAVARFFSGATRESLAARAVLIRSLSRPDAADAAADFCLREARNAA